MVLSLAPVRSQRLVLPLWTAAEVAAIRGFETGARAPSSTTGGGAPSSTAGGGAPSSTTRGGAPSSTTGGGAPSSTTGGGAPSSTTGGGIRGEWHPDFPREDDVDAASLWREGDIWGPRSIVRGTTVLGSIGFFGPPEPAADGVPETEVGYGLVREAWGWGFATEALRALLAETDPMGVRLRASVLPENKASLRVLAKCGFTQLRGTTPDGELVMVRRA